MPMIALWLATTAAAALPPADVKALLARREQCQHWAGEDPYDAARGREIEAAIRRLRCDRIDRDAAQLRKLHRNKPAVVKLLDTSAE
ncbi:hypothetical protein [Sphingomonas sp.]|uniref:hypothetical protein n=1 Tax=Sphingomonas sp. TaxID=28214 RepID=UPI003B3AC877